MNFLRKILLIAIVIGSFIETSSCLPEINISDGVKDTDITEQILQAPSFSEIVLIYNGIRVIAHTIDIQEQRYLRLPTPGFGLQCAAYALGIEKPSEDLVVKQYAPEGGVEIANAEGQQNPFWQAVANQNHWNIEVYVQPHPNERGIVSNIVDPILKVSGKDAIEMRRVIIYAPPGLDKMGHYTPLIEPGNISALKAYIKLQGFIGAPLFKPTDRAILDRLSVEAHSKAAKIQQKERELISTFENKVFDAVKRKSIGKLIECFNMLNPKNKNRIFQLYSADEITVIRANIEKSIRSLGGTIPLQRSSANYSDAEENSTSSYSDSTGTTPLIDSAIVQKLQDAFNGTKPLYAITVTRTGSEVLTPVEIYIVFSVLRELFCGHDEDYATNLKEIIESVGKNYLVRYRDLLDYSFLKTSDKLGQIDNKEQIFEKSKLALDQATVKYLSEQELLNNIRSNIQLIVFNEYFFGKKHAFIEDYLERQIKSFGWQFINAILVLNYLRQEYSRITLFELDRSANIIYSSLLLNDLIQRVKPPNLLPQKPGFLRTIVPEYDRLIEHSKLVSQYVYGELPPKVETDQLSEYFSYLKQKVQQSNFFQIVEPILENRTSYLWQNRELMFYNKATYFDEVKTLSLKDTVSYVYRFGCGADILSENTELARALHQNISTEICRDLFCGIRSNSPFKKIHIIQSNTINPEDEECKTNIPPCSFIIHADPKTKGKVYKKNGDTMIDQHSKFEYEFDILHNHYTIRIFEIAF